MSALGVALVGEEKWALQTALEVSKDTRYRFAGIVDHTRLSEADQQVWRNSSLGLLHSRVFRGGREIGSFLNSMGAGPSVWLVLQNGISANAVKPLLDTGRLRGVISESDAIEGVLSRLINEIGVLQEQARITTASAAHGPARVTNSIPGEMPFPELTAHHPDKPVERVEGLKIITVTNSNGGQGKTTVATNFAVEARQRGANVLVVGLNQADNVPLLYGLKINRNILMFRGEGDEEGLRAAIQQVELETGQRLDVLGGFPSPSMEHEVDLEALARTCRDMGYEVLVFDLSSDAFVRPALYLTTQLVLVAKSTLSSAKQTIDAYQEALQVWQGRMQASPVLVLNEFSLDPNEFHQTFMKITDRVLPTINIRNDPAIPEAQDERTIPLYRSKTLQEGMKRLCDMVLPDLRGRKYSRGRLPVINDPEMGDVGSRPPTRNIILNALRNWGGAGS